MDTTIYLIRHGETPWNAQQRYIGSSDISLSDVGKTQVQRLASALQSIPFDVIYTSPLKRAQETAHVIHQGRSCNILIENDLRELNFGLWEGLTQKEIEYTYKKELLSWSIDPYENNAPSGESMKHVSDRIYQAYEKITTSHQKKHIALIGHGGAFNILLCRLFQIRPTALWQFRLSPASISIIYREDNAPVLQKLNDTSHLS